MLCVTFTDIQRVQWSDDAKPRPQLIQRDMYINRMAELPMLHSLPQRLPTPNIQTAVVMPANTVKLNGDSCTERNRSNSDPAEPQRRKNSTHSTSSSDSDGSAVVLRRKNKAVVNGNG